MLCRIPFESLFLQGDTFLSYCVFRGIAGCLVRVSCCIPQQSKHAACRVEPLLNSEFCNRCHRPIEGGGSDDTLAYIRL